MSLLALKLWARRDSALRKHAHWNPYESSKVDHSLFVGRQNESRNGEHFESGLLYLLDRVIRWRQLKSQQSKFRAHESSGVSYVWSLYPHMNSNISLGGSLLGRALDREVNAKNLATALGYLMSLPSIWKNVRACSVEDSLQHEK